MNNDDKFASTKNFLITSISKLLDNKEVKETLDLLNKMEDDLMSEEQKYTLTSLVFRVQVTLILSAFQASERSILLATQGWIKGEKSNWYSYVFKQDFSKLLKAENLEAYTIIKKCLKEKKVDDDAGEFLWSFAYNSLAKNMIYDYLLSYCAHMLSCVPINEEQFSADEEYSSFAPTPLNLTSQHFFDYANELIDKFEGRSVLFVDINILDGIPQANFR